MHRDKKAANKNRAADSDRGRHGERGQSLVEAALALPLLLLLLVLAVDAARAFDALIVLKNAAREGARFASLENPIPEDDIRQLVQEDVRGSGTNVARMEQFDGTDANSLQIVEGTDSVTVIVSYDFRLWFGGLVGVGSFRLSAEAVMPRRGVMFEAQP